MVFYIMLYLIISLSFTVFLFAYDSNELLRGLIYSLFSPFIYGFAFILLIFTRYVFYLKGFILFGKKPKTISQDMILKGLWTKDNNKKTSYFQKLMYKPNKKEKELYKKHIKKY